MQGFASGALGSLGGSAFQAYGGKFAQSFVGTVAFSSVSSGIGSWATGGNFWKGAATGAMIGALNHGAHKVQKQVQKSRLQKAAQATSAFANDAKLGLLGRSGNLGKFGKQYMTAFRRLGWGANAFEAGSTWFLLYIYR